MSFVAGPIAWRLPIACQILPAIVVSVILFGLPESPRYLIQKGLNDEAVAVMCQVYNVQPNDEYVMNEKAAIIHALAVENENPFQWSKIYKKDKVQTGWRLFLACLVLFMNQVCY
jgi:hypothetical protein